MDGVPFHEQRTANFAASRASASAWACARRAFSASHAAAFSSGVGVAASVVIVVAWVDERTCHADGGANAAVEVDDTATMINAAVVRSMVRGRGGV